MTTTAAHRRRSRVEPETNGHTATVRVAIYTRKSTEKGLEQEFSTLDNQREAAEAYVHSQISNGWIALPERYDDGGYSGGTTRRPAFERLRADVMAGKIDVVAVYRLDRLSRSQRDFLELLAEFEKHDVKFVSVTEHFDTSTPMGRFALGIMIQVAQLEREVISERITDKMRASRRRGMWTGGRPPLGYDVVDKRLVVNQEEARVVRDIVQTYLRLGALQETVDELRRRAIHAKRWKTKGGRVMGGQPFDRSTLRKLLVSPYQVGRVRAGGEIVNGQHEAIVDEATWDAVQEMLADSGSGGRGPHQASGSVLGGLLACGACGAPMTPTYTGKGTKRYSYYECTTARRQGARACPRARVRASKIEAAILRQLRRLAREPAIVDAAVAAARSEAEAATEALVLELRRHEEAARLQAVERRRLTEAVAGADEAPPSLVARLADVDRLAAETEARIAELRAEIDAARGLVIDEDELREVLVAFEPVWEHLFPAERARVLGLLFERVTYDPPTDRISVKLHAGGVKALAAEAREEAA